MSALPRSIRKRKGETDSEEIKVFVFLLLLLQLVFIYVFWMYVLFKYFNVDASCLKCYNCQGKSCPDDLTNFNKTVECTANQECVSEAIYQNDTLIALNRLCRNKESCFNACSQKLGAANEQNCVFCCATDLCNTNTPDPNAATALQSPICLLFSSVAFVVSVILFG